MTFATAAWPTTPLPHSGLPGLLWPALPAPAARQMLALQWQLEHSQWLPPETLAQRQLTQLRALCAHALAQSPWYRELLARELPELDGLAAAPERLTWDLFARWPLLPKAALASQQAALFASRYPPEHGEFYWISTTGSTGVPVQVAHTQTSQLMRSALNLRHLLWHGIDLRKTYGEIHFDRARERLANWGEGIASVYPTGAAATINSAAALDEQLAWLLAEKPAHLHAKGGNLRALLLLARERGAALEGLQTLLPYAENLPPDLRDLAREVCGARVIDIYSCAEAGTLALQCPHHTHYHAQSEGVLLEVLDDAGRACAPGQIGQVVLTHLSNFAMPLIRYALGDYAQVGAPCDCGRGLPVLTRIMGRGRNMAVDPDGRRFWPAFPAADWIAIAPLRQVQLVQHTPREIEMRYVMDRALSEVESGQLTQALRARLGYAYEMRYTRVESITRTAREKYEDFVSLCAPDAQGQA